MSKYMTTDGRREEDVDEDLQKKKYSEDKCVWGRRYTRQKEFHCVFYLIFLCVVSGFQPSPAQVQTVGLVSMMMVLTQHV